MSAFEYGLFIVFALLVVVEAMLIRHYLKHQKQLEDALNRLDKAMRKAERLNNE